MFSVSYVGNRVPNNPENININQISPQWNAQCDVERGGDRQLCDGSAGQIANPFLGIAGFARYGLLQLHHPFQVQLYSSVSGVLETLPRTAPPTTERPGTTLSRRSGRISFPEACRCMQRTRMQGRSAPGAGWINSTMFWRARLARQTMSTTRSRFRESASCRSAETGFCFRMQIGLSMRSSTVGRSARSTRTTAGSRGAHRFRRKRETIFDHAGNWEMASWRTDH